MSDDLEAAVSTANALQQWRVAERVLAVARRGTLAAEAAADAAGEAALAALATANAAKAALASAVLAEQSAAKTAMASKEAARLAVADVADAQSETSLAEVVELEAHARYRSSIERAADRNVPRTAESS
jgi:hypothetical protein